MHHTSRTDTAAATAAETAAQTPTSHQIHASTDYVSHIAELLRMEADAIRRTAEGLRPAQIEKAMGLLLACRGKIALVGIGKSGIVARKIAATLTSTGTVALYLHPSDALHGDIGIVTSDDVAIILSNSGETAELTALLPCLKQRRVPIIAIVGNTCSTLSRSADAVLDASVEVEAGPFNLAPTTSTIVALAIGDALAMTLMQAKRVTPEDFALNHPAGRLGRRLTLRVCDLMHSGPDNPIVWPRASWFEVIDAISAGGLGAVNVVDEAARLVGIITDGDLRRSIQKTQTANLEELRANNIMTPEPIIVAPELLAYEALKLMENRPSQISVLPVIDQDARCIGLIRLHDIVRSGLA